METGCIRNNIKQHRALKGCTRNVIVKLTEIFPSGFRSQTKKIVGELLVICKIRSLHVGFLKFSISASNFVYPIL